MPILHAETLARYQNLSPQQFMDSVILSTLRDHLYMAYNVITVYTQIVMTLPVTDNLFISPIPNNVIGKPIELREVMRRMQLCVVEANNLVQGPFLGVSVERDILQRVSEVRQPIERIDRWAAAIENDVMLKTVKLPGLKGKSAARIASEIREYMFDSNQVLIYAQAYALRWSKRE